APRRDLYHHAIFEIWAEQPPAAAIYRFPGIRLERAAGDQGIPAASEDPARRVLPDFGEILREEAVDMRKTGIRRDIVQHDDGILILENLFIGQAANQFVGRIVG